MSKILFWSPYHGQGQTSNLYVMAFIFGLLYKKKVLLMQTHFKNNNLESPLVGQNVDQAPEVCEIFEDIGIDMAITFSNMNNLNQKTLENCCLTFLNSTILMMPGTKIKMKDTFDREIGGSVNRLLKAAEEYVDLILIDSNSSEDELSMRLMSTADLIVINLTQRRYVLEKFFLEYGDRFVHDQRIFYLFGDYDNDSNYNIYNCRRKFSNYIKSSNSGVIPYCTRYMDAQNESNLIPFLKEGLCNNKNKTFIDIIRNIPLEIRYGILAQEETDYFFNASLKSANKISAMLNIPIRRYFGGRNRWVLENG